MNYCGCADSIRRESRAKARRAGTGGVNMIHNLMYWGVYAFQTLFFIGLGGCVIVVAMCWVRIGRDSLKGRE